MQPVRRRVPHQLVPRGMKAHLIDAIAESVVGQQLRLVAIRLKSERDDLRLPRQAAKLAQLVVRRARRLAHNRLG